MIITSVCRHCGKIFQSADRRFCCDACKDIDNELFDKIRDYLRQFPNSNAIQIAEGLGIETMEVVSYIDEGRLVASPPGVFKQI